MKKITLWHRHNAKEERFEYNHYEDGWDVSATPSVVPENNDRWSKEHAYMDGSTVRHLNEIKQPLEEVSEKYYRNEVDVYCIGCGMDEQDGTYKYRRTVVNGDEWYCTNCKDYHLH